MKKLTLIAPIIILFSCSTLDQIARDTTESKEYLEEIRDNTSSQDQDDSFEDTLDVFYPRIRFDQLFTENIVKDTSYAISENWFKFLVTTQPDIGSQVGYTYDGFVHAANPDVLFVKAITEDSIPQAKIVTQSNNELSEDMTMSDKNERKAENVEAAAFQTFDPFTELKLSELQFQQQLVSGNGVFDGFKLISRQFHFTDLSKYSFNNARLDNCSLYQNNAHSADQLELSSNTMMNTYIWNSKIYSISLRNWHLKSNSQRTSTNWFRTTVFGADMNDVVFDNQSWEEVACNNCIIRNTNYGYLKNWTVSNSTFATSTIERANFISASFRSTTFVGGTMMDNDFDQVSFIGSSGKPTRFKDIMYIQGRYKKTNFQWGVEIINSRFFSSIFEGGSFNQVNFSGESYIKDSKFLRTQFMDVQFNDTGLWNVQFGDPNDPYKTLMTRCDFRAAKFGENVTFYNVNLIGSKFPPRSQLDEWGVRFIGCENEPQ